MTFSEVKRAIEAYNNRTRRDYQIKANMDYKQVLLLGRVIGQCLGGKDELPPVDEFYSEFFSEELKARREEEEQKRRTQQSVANFLNFANAFNKRFRGVQDDV